MDFLLIIIIPSVGIFFFGGATCPTRILIEEHLIIIYLSYLETAFYALQFDQVRK